MAVVKWSPPGPRTLPLGIDLGAERLRVALAQCNADGSIELVAVASRQVAGDPSRALAEAISELRTPERRGVFALGEPRAILRTLRFPPMHRHERERAAQFEATRFVDYPIGEAHVCTVALGSEGDAVIGVVRKDTIASIVALGRSAGLHLTAVDDTAFAVRRALSDVDAVLDIGASASQLYVFAGRLPIGRSFRIGGAAFTQAVAEALGTDDVSARRRKHSHGIAGCGESVRDHLIADVADALADYRAEGLGDVRSLALIGNGSRLPELPELIERATAVRVRPATFASAISRTLPPDVLRAAAPDWCVAFGLALWAAA